MLLRRLLSRRCGRLLAAWTLRLTKLLLIGWWLPLLRAGALRLAGWLHLLRTRVLRLTGLLRGRRGRLLSRHARRLTKLLTGRMRLLRARGRLSRQMLRLPARRSGRLRLTLGDGTLRRRRLTLSRALRLRLAGRLLGGRVRRLAGRGWLLPLCGRLRRLLSSARGRPLAVFGITRLGALRRILRQDHAFLITRRGLRRIRQCNGGQKRGQEQALFGLRLDRHHVFGSGRWMRHRVWAVT